jgi:simple sugar transport system permease protein
LTPAPNNESSPAVASGVRRRSPGLAHGPVAMKNLIRIYLEKPELAGIVLLAVLTAVFELRSGGAFLSADNLRGILGLLPEVGLVSIGVTILMICGEFDLSVGSTFALTPMATSLMIIADVPAVLAILLGLAIAGAIGFLNGLITLSFAIPSFITTLGMLFIVRSLTIVISGGFPPLLPDDLNTSAFTQFVGPGTLFRASFIWFLAIAAAAAGMMAMSNLGNWIRATGGNLEAASAMGVPARRVKLFCFVLCAMIAGFGGVIQVFRLHSPLPSIGDGLELQAVAAAVIGGTALTGGVGTVLGAIVGALLIRIIDNGLVMSQVDANWFKFAVGALTIFAVASNAGLRRAARRMKAPA